LGGEDPNLVALGLLNEDSTRADIISAMNHVNSQFAPGWGSDPARGQQVTLPGLKNTTDKLAEHRQGLLGELAKVVEIVAKNTPLGAFVNAVLKTSTLEDAGRAVQRAYAKDVTASDLSAEQGMGRADRTPAAAPWGEDVPDFAAAAFEPTPDVDRGSSPAGPEGPPDDPSAAAAAAAGSYSFDEAYTPDYSFDEAYNTDVGLFNKGGLVSKSKKKSNKRKRNRMGLAVPQ
jgi:hypothetical protein